MSIRNKIAANINHSKATRLNIAGEFGNYRFGRDALAHTFRYLFAVRQLIRLSKNLGRPIRILDIGCGDAYVARIFNSSFRVKKTDFVEMYYGFDIDDVQLQETELSFPPKFPRKLIVGDITKNDLDQFSDKSMDAIICFEIIEHLQPEFVPPLLRQIKRLADYAIISTPNFSGGSGKLPEDHIKEWDAKELQLEFYKAELQIISKIGTFCNLNEVKRIAKENEQIEEMYNFLEPMVDDNLLSIIMAKFIGDAAQNILYVCECY